MIADYDDEAGDPNDVLASMEETTLPKLAAKYNIGFSFGGRNQEQTETMGGLRVGAFIGLSLDLRCFWLLSLPAIRGPSSSCR